ncbi:DMT family transporter [Pseudodonghicola flavimaris]|uniref:DMT family transporter n=1 Tax=Pseudodonghicola flavimaris TaxID=3050036 RepID=A0ABT7EVI9_9RHOB|nr:DMT family transporter [Pseudodonghicola flavimaris]MDK3016363.1 DMT family transporter [Pseudodonghicola flavimaris]
MGDKRAIDPLGAATLTGFALLLAFNQVVIKVTSGGLAPVFQAGLRSAIAAMVLLIWIVLRRVPLRLPRGALLWGLISGAVFGFEFMALFVALDHTTVSRASVIFYSMPVWLGLAAHLWLPGERLSGARMAGMALALAGVALAMADRSQGAASLLGDSLALAATLGWAAIVMITRATPLAQVSPSVQLFFQVAVSAPVMLIAAALIGEGLRAPTALHWAGLWFQGICVVSLGFLLWFHLLTIYTASAVASFSFLSPVFAVALGWLLLGEQVGPGIWGALALVATGIVLINRVPAARPG